MNISFNLL